MQFFIHLDDYTDRGTPWPFYEQAEIIDYEDASGDIDALRPELQFRKFQGSIDSDYIHMMAKSQMEVPIPNKYLEFEYTGLVFLKK